MSTEERTSVYPADSLIVIAVTLSLRGSIIRELQAAKQPAM